MMHMVLNIVEPTTVPTPMPASLCTHATPDWHISSSGGEKIATAATKSSGDEEPAAMNVAPATSAGIAARSMRISSEETKKSSQQSARP